MSSLFNTLKLDAEILENLKSLNFQEMTPIQKESLPLILEGEDVIAQAKTGSGKTAAFGLGIIQKLSPQLFRPQALVLCPTRELAEQVTTELRRLARSISNIKIQALCGGTSEYHQSRSLHHGVHIIVGTPGRVRKFIHQKHIDIRNIEMLVLDEADRMLDMGFTEEVNTIISALPKKRQTLLFSATFPPEIRALSKGIQKQAKSIKVDDQHEENIIKQIAYPVQKQADKKEALIKLLLAHQPESAIVFCNMKDTCRDVLKALNGKRISALALHGDMEQRDRNLTLAKFSNQSCHILVATDVAARGLDIQDLSAVISYDITLDSEVHLHRIGRTGRAGKEGFAFNLYTPKEKYDLEKIEEMFNLKIERAELEDLKVQEGFSFEPVMQTMLIAAGRKTKLRPGDILGALTNDCGIPGEAVGKIKIFDIFSFVAIKKEYFNQALNALKEGTIKGKTFKIMKV